MNGNEQNKGNPIKTRLVVVSLHTKMNSQSITSCDSIRNVVSGHEAKSMEFHFSNIHYIDQTHDNLWLLLHHNIHPNTKKRQISAQLQTIKYAPFSYLDVRVQKI